MSKVIKNSATNRVSKASGDRKTGKVIQASKISKSDKESRVVNTKIRGVDVDTTRFVMHETPTPATNGAQVIFTVANAYVAGLLEVFLDGLLQIKNTDYTETTSTTFTMTTAPDSDENLRVNYIKQ